MRTIALVVTLALFGPWSAAEEPAFELAKRVIEDKTLAFEDYQTQVPTMSIISADVRDPRGDQLVAASKSADEVIEAYLLGEKVPEKVRVAFAIRILASKRIQNERPPHLFGKFDKEKNDQFLEEGLILAARLEKLLASQINQKVPAPDSSEAE
ncbi:MAG: hypothetical protein AAGB14_02270 [Verrucomicrobiota bacterium]